MIYFDANQVPDSEPGDDYSTIPPGIYDAEVVKAEEKQTQAGNGSYINLQVRILGPTHANRVVFDTFTRNNPNAEAVRIGYEQLAKCCKAIGRPVLNQLADLVGGRCQIRVGIEKSDGYDDRNCIKSYIPYAQAPQQPPPQGAGQPPPPQYAGYGGHTAGQQPPPQQPPQGHPQTLPQQGMATGPQPPPPKVAGAPPPQQAPQQAPTLTLFDDDLPF